MRNPDRAMLRVFQERVERLDGGLGEDVT